MEMEGNTNHAPSATEWECSRAVIPCYGMTTANDRLFFEMWKMFFTVTWIPFHTPIDIASKSVLDVKSVFTKQPF